MADHVPRIQTKVKSIGLPQERRKDWLDTQEDVVHRKDLSKWLGLPQERRKDWLDTQEDVVHRKDLSKWLGVPQTQLPPSKEGVFLDTMETNSKEQEEHQLSLEDGDVRLHENASLLAHTSSMSKGLPTGDIEMAVMPPPMPAKSQMSTDSQNLIYHSGSVSFPYPTVQRSAEVLHQVRDSLEEQATTSFFSSIDEGKNQQPRQVPSATGTPPDMLHVSVKIVHETRVNVVHVPNAFYINCIC